MKDAKRKDGLEMNDGMTSEDMSDDAQMMRSGVNSNNDDNIY